MPNFQIKHRWTGATLFEGDFGTMRLCVEGAVKVGAYLARANLTGANLTGAYLTGAYLAGANLDGANLTGAYLTGAYLARAYLDGAIIRPQVTLNRAPLRRATRADGYEFLLWDTSVGWRVSAGCRFFAMDEARHHWETTRGDGDPLGDESRDILTMFELAIQREAA